MADYHFADHNVTSLIPVPPRRFSSQNLSPAINDRAGDALLNPPESQGASSFAKRNKIESFNQSTKMPRALTVVDGGCLILDVRFWIFDLGCLVLDV